MTTTRSASASTGLKLRGQSGVSLIELMVSVAIGLALVAGLLTVLASTSSNSKTNERTSELMTNGRYALDALRHELRQAGFRGYTWAEPTAPDTAALGAFTNECLASGATSTSFVSNIRQGVWGSDNTNPFSSTCIPSANYASNNAGIGSDVLVIRGVADLPTTTPQANTVYFRSAYAVGQIFRGAVGPTFAGTQTPLADFAVKVYAYYISPYTNSATESPKVPALYRVALQSNGSMVRELVASGIEEFQVQYGVLTTAPDTRYYDILTGTSTNTLASDWDNVNSVRIWLLARNETAEPEYLNTSSYQMGNKTVTVNDGYRRQLFTTVVQLRN